MTYVEQLLTNQGRSNRLLGEDILQQRQLEAMHLAANQPARSMNVYGSTCPLCCGDVDDVAFLETGVAACQSCRDKELAAVQSRSRWISHELASAAASRVGQGQAHYTPK
jgi:hypothetical protein